MRFLEKCYQIGFEARNSHLSLAYYHLKPREDGSHGLWSRAAGDFEEVYFIFIWYRIIRYMLYCICAFFKCILEVCGVVHDILP